MESRYMEGFGYRDDSDAGMAGEFIGGPWTIDEVRERALSLGKKFEPNSEIADRLADDLSKKGVVVLFTPEDVKAAISIGAVQKEVEENLMNLVKPEGLNDIAVIPMEAVEKSKRTEFELWFLANNRC